LKLFKVFLSFLLTLLLFWYTPRFTQQTQQRDYFESAAEQFQIDHDAINRHSIDDDPEVTASVITPADTSSYLLRLLYRNETDTSHLVKPMGQVAGSYDLHSATIPHLLKGQSYYYHLELTTNEGRPITRIPEEPGREIRLYFEGAPGLFLWAVHVGLMYLAAMYGFLSFFDAVTLHRGERKLGKLSHKVLMVAFFLLFGGLVAGALVSRSRFGYFWGGWPIGANQAHSMIEILIIYWLALPVLFKGTLFRFKPEKNIVSAGGAVVLTLTGVLFMIVVYLTQDLFVGIPL
jgi:hypothetical protein